MQTERNATVANRIKELRIQKNIPQKDFATMINLSPTAYSRIENGKTEITINTLYIIAEKLGKGVEDLLQLSLSTGIKGDHNIVMSNFNNGTLHITVSASDLEKLSKKEQK